MIPFNSKWGLILAEIAGAKPTNLTPSGTYSGSVITNGYTKPEGIDVTGDESGTNAGTYTASYSPDADHCWDDDTVDTVDVVLTIAKASGYCRLSAYSFSFDQGNSCTFTITASGTPYVVSQSGCTVTISGNTGTVTGSTVGSGSFTIACYESDNYNAATASACSVTITDPTFTLVQYYSYSGSTFSNCYSYYTARNGVSWSNVISDGSYLYPSSQHAGDYGYLYRIRNYSSAINSEYVQYEPSRNLWTTLLGNNSAVYPSSIVSRYTRYSHAA